MGIPAKVVGIGTVDLPTKVSPTRTGPRSHGNLRLKNVLHVPGGLCNIIGWPILEDYEAITSFSRGPTGTSGSIANLSDGRSVAYFKPQSQGVRFLEVRLSGPPVGPLLGPSPFDTSGTYRIGATWPESERERLAATVVASPQIKYAGPGPLTSAEKAWLKEHYGNEFKFLRAYGLSIYKDEDREEGRTIVRAMMSHDDHETPARAIPVIGGDDHGTPVRFIRSGVVLGLR